MRILKLCIALGLVAGIAVPAGAAKLVSGPIYGPAASENWGWGTVYWAPASGTYDAQADFVAWDGTGTPPTDINGNPVPYKILPLGTPDDEDSWGIYRLSKLTRGEVKNSGFIGALEANPFWTPTMDNEEALATFEGAIDGAVTISVLGDNLTPLNPYDDPIFYNVDSTGFVVRLYAVDTAVWYPPEFSTPDFDTKAEVFAEWVPAGSELLLQATSTSFSFTSNISLTGVPTQEGQATIFLDVDESVLGRWTEYIENNFYDFAVPESDIYLSWQTKDNLDEDGFLYKSTDEISFYVVPEPLTMVVFLGASGMLGSYIRRRRIA
jgi:hypothetical protein